VSFTIDRGADFTRQVHNALEDEAAQPLDEVQRAAPEGCNYFSELEASISEWSFGYGVAWAMARMADPLLSSSAAADIAEAAVSDAWRLFSGESWTALMADDRTQRGPVEGDAPAAGPEPAADSEPAEDHAPATDLGQFMGKVSRTRPRRAQRAVGA
jgi:hypothetical protein